ncbi:acetyltransferase [Enterococcus faecium]|nr:acetyltransferase [Enterococcus faecium]EMF0630836.1 acetyltransferase [Enterococcus faecium]NTQ65882.1 acetyltransferase [Enterococcus faecium]
MEGSALKKLIIIGASGHGKVVADIAVKRGYEKIVFLDDNENVIECGGFPVVGKVAEAVDMQDDKIVAIGNSKIREHIQSNLSNVITLIHPNAVISRRVKIGKGTVVMAGVVINSDVVVGDGCIINTGATVDHDCKIGDYSHISVGAHISGTVYIGSNVWIGAGAVVSNNLSIFSECMIGAGTVVIKNIEKAGTYVGVPAKEI